MPYAWRVMGMWKDDKQFLVVLGRSREECYDRLEDALEDYDHFDFERIDSIWIERWDPGTLSRPAEWFPVEEIGLKRMKQSRAASYAHSMLAALAPAG